MFEIYTLSLPILYQHTARTAINVFVSTNEKEARLDAGEDHFWGKGYVL